MVTIAAGIHLKFFFLIHGAGPGNVTIVILGGGGGQITPIPVSDVN